MRPLIISIFTHAAVAEHMRYSAKILDDTRLYTILEAQYPANKSEKVAMNW